MRAAASCMRARTRPSYFDFLLRGYRARYKDTDRRGTTNWIFSAGRERAFKGPPSYKSRFSLSPEARLSETVSGEEFEIAIHVQERVRDLAQGEFLPVFAFRWFADLNIDHSTMRNNRHLLDEREEETTETRRSSSRCASDTRNLLSGSAMVRRNAFGTNGARRSTIRCRE